MKKTFYYSNELHDDFASTRSISGREIDENFPYFHGRLWNFAASVIYRLLVTPLVFLFCKLYYGVRIRGRAHLRGLKGGYYLYANHTQHAADAFLPTLVAFPTRCHVVTEASAVSLPGLGNLVQMLGAIPLPTDPHGLRRFAGVLDRRIKQGRAVCIYPEAHIWPYYTHIRPFPSGSFAYPVHSGVPAVPYTVTYRPRRILKKRHPNITVYIGEPVYPAAGAPARQERQRLRDEVYEFMNDTAERIDQPEFIRYVRCEDSAEP